MTCIAGVETEDSVVIGGDSAASSYGEVIGLDAPKVFLNNGVLFGGAGSARLIQLAQYNLTIPSPYDNGYGDYSPYLIKSVVPLLRKLVEENKLTDPHGLMPGLFLVGVGNRLYMIQSDFSIIRNRCGYAAIGSGAYHATGSLSHSGQLKPKQRVLNALQAATDHTPFVRGPFTVVETKNRTEDPFS